jgi:hypothetical protein
VSFSYIWQNFDLVKLNSLQRSMKRLPQSLNSAGQLL